MKVELPETRRLIPTVAGPRLLFPYVQDYTTAAPRIDQEGDHVCTSALASRVEVWRARTHLVDLYCGKCRKWLGDGSLWATTSLEPVPRAEMKWRDMGEIYPWPTTRPAGGRFLFGAKLVRANHTISESDSSFGAPKRRYTCGRCPAKYSVKEAVMVGAVLEKLEAAWAALERINNPPGSPPWATRHGKRTDGVGPRIVIVLGKDVG